MSFGPVGDTFSDSEGQRKRMFRERFRDNLTYQDNTAWEWEARTLAPSADSLSSAFLHLDKIPGPTTP